MSAGPFLASFYETDEGEVLNARVQPETVFAENPAPAGPATWGISANMTGGTRQNGVNARVVYGKWITAPAGYLANGRVTLPILQQTAYNAINKGDTITYLGGTFRVTGKRGESLV